MTLNVLMGGEARFAQLVDVVARASPDVLVLQECLGWEPDGERLSSMARALGAPHAHLGIANARPSGNRYHVALVSRLPFASAARTHTEGFTHCCVDVDVAAAGGAVRVVGAHFASADDDTRLREADALLALVHGNERVVVAGDLNALARHDPYPRVEELDERMKRAGISKYGSPPRFDVIERFTRAGFVDALHARPRDPARWVTARREKNGERVDTRTDYVLLSPALARELVEADVVDVAGASDHNAVIATLR